MFSVVNRAPRDWHPKEWVLGVNINDRYKAFPYSELAKAGNSVIEDELDGEKFTIVWDQTNKSALMMKDGVQQAAITAFWFAWYAFYPETLVFEASERGGH